MKTRFSFPILSFLALAACGSHDQGVARISFGFDPKAPRLDHSAFLFVRVVENKTGGATLGGKDAVPFDPTAGAMLDAITIPNGDNRVVIAEIRDGSSATARVLYYGISAPFSISPGKITDVTVTLQLTAPPGGARIQIVTSTPQFVKDPMVSLLLVSDTGVKARLSNYVSFPDMVPGIADSPTKTVDLDPSTAMMLPGGLTAHMVTWNLNAGLGDPCMLRDYCPRTVFARFIDARAYESETKTSSIVLDTKPPSVIPNTVAVHISPPPMNPLKTVSKATVASTASVSFTFSEPVARSFSVSSASVPAWACAGAQLTYVCTAQIPMGAHEGTENIQLAATDRAGNAGMFALGSFEIDTTPPMNPDTSPGKILYTRIPWGRGSSVAVSHYTLQGAASAVEPGSTVIAYNGSDTSRNEEIGRTGAKADGSFDAFDLDRADRDQVFVLAVDAAGNQSNGASGMPGHQAVAVRDSAWVATLSRNATFNPHRAFSVPAVRPSLGQNKDSIHDFTAGDDAAVSGRGGGKVDVSFGAPWDAIVSSAASPNAQTEPAMSYDRARGVAVLFGGNHSDPMNPGAAGVLSSDTWEWNGHTWTKVIPEGQSPSARLGHQLVYDAARGESLLFGGTDGANNLQDTWAWDGARWIELATTTATTPAPRVGHQMSYDSARGRVVLFGGTFAPPGGGAPMPLNDTWEWDGDRWIRMIPAHKPPARGASALAYDSRRQKTVMFGGLMNVTMLGDTWEWDGADWTVPTMTSTITPTARRNHALEYDEILGRTVLFGGDALDQNNMGPVFGDSWSWDGARWTRSSTVVASGISQHALVYDAVRRQLVAFGGIGQAANAIFSDTLISNAGGRWLKVTPNGIVPPARERGVMAYDAVSKKLILYGGLAIDFSPLFDTWIYDGYNWTLNPMGPNDPFAGGPVMARDERRNVIVLSGITDPTNPMAPELVAEWTNGQWTAPTSSTAPPSERDVTALAFDAATGSPFMFGGLYDPTGASTPLADGWIWNGLAWKSAGPAHMGDAKPPARFDHAMAGDTARKRVVLFGGIDSTALERSDTWEWDGMQKAWTTMSTVSVAGPPGRLSHRMVYDSARRRTLMFFGQNTANTVFGDVWQWDGARWNQLPVSGAHPAPRVRPAAAYDPGRAATVVFGGNVNGAVSDTWELKLRPDDRPGAVFTVDWTKANQPSGAITSIEVDAYAGGRGFLDNGMGGGMSKAGAAIEAWDAYRGAWVRWGSNDASPDMPDVLTAGTSTSAPPVRFVDGTGLVNVRLTTNAGAGNGTPFPDLTIDDFALVVRYRR